MKIIAILLSAYFLALNFTPCNDAEAISDNSQIEVVVDFDGNLDHSATDLCSPFCQCHCCHIHTIDFGITSFEPLTISISSEIFTYFDSLGKDIPHSILQPPKV